MNKIAVNKKRLSKKPKRKKTAKEQPWFLYILECGDKTLYTGISNNVEKRFKNHCAGKGARYTKTHLPLKLMYVEKCKNRHDAILREIVVKKLSRLKKLMLISQSLEITK